VPKGVIPLTAADPDFPIAPPIKEALLDYVRGGYLSGMPRDEAEVQLKEMCRSGKLTTWETERTKLYLSTVKLEQGFV
jgi:cystathionine beta-lyase